MAAAGQALQRGGLTRPVRAQEPDDLTLSQRERHVLDRAHLTVGPSCDRAQPRAQTGPPLVHAEMLRQPLHLDYALGDQPVRVVAALALVTRQVVVAGPDDSRGVYGSLVSRSPM